MAWAFMSSKPEPTLKSRAMRFLARREHTRVELRRKLATRAQEGEDVDGLLDELTQKGWLSDARFAEQAARAKARRFGPIKLAHYLKARGVGEEAIAAGLQRAGADGISSLQAVWRTRFGAPPNDEREKLRQVRFLQGRGFAVDDIFKFLRSLQEDR
jgi:regulatory protein